MVGLASKTFILNKNTEKKYESEIQIHDGLQAKFLGVLHSFIFEQGSWFFKGYLFFKHPDLEKGVLFFKTKF